MAYVISDDCIAYTCIDECPVGAISEGDKYSIDPEMCKAIVELVGRRLSYWKQFIRQNKTGNQ